MPTVMKVRRQGGARVVTLPGALLDRIGAGVGTALALDVRGGAIVATPILEPTPAAGRRYTLAELLVGAEHLPALYGVVAGALDGEAMGQEMGGEIG